MELYQEVKKMYYKDGKRDVVIYLLKNGKKFDFMKAKYKGVREPFYNKEDWQFLGEIKTEIDKLTK